MALFPAILFNKLYHLVVELVEFVLQLLMIDDGRWWVVKVVLLEYRDYWLLGFVLLLLETFEDILNLLSVDGNRHRLHKVIIATVVLLF